MTTTEPASDATPASDPELIRAVRSGDAGAYGILFERHGAAARCLALQFVRSPPDAEDVVAEAFTRVLSVISKGAGPTAAFRPYLLATVRRIAFDQLRRQRAQVPADEVPDPGDPFADPAIASLEHSLVRRAFMSLPERWTAVLWHTEIEQSRPAEIALLFGLTPNGVAALSYRAREALRQAYLQMHLSGVVGAECRPIARRLGAYVRGALSRRESRRVDGHLQRCAECQAARAELVSINDSLRGLLAPVLLGSGAAGYLAAHAGRDAAASAGATGAAAGHAALAGHATAAGHAALAGHATAAAGHGFAMTVGTLARTAVRWFKIASLSQPVIPAAAGVLVAAVAIPAVTLVHRQPHGQQPRLAGPGSGRVTSPGRSGGAPGDKASSGGVRSPLTVPPSSPTVTARSPDGTPSPTDTPDGPSPSPSWSSPTPSSSSSPATAAALSLAVRLNGRLRSAWWRSCICRSPTPVRRGPGISRRAWHCPRACAMPEWAARNRRRGPVARARRGLPAPTARSAPTSPRRPRSKWCWSTSPAVAAPYSRPWSATGSPRARSPGPLPASDPAAVIYLMV